MKATIKKTIAILLIMILVLSSMAVFASAEPKTLLNSAADASESDEPAEQEKTANFSVKTIIESMDTITVGVYLEKGSFSSMELETNFSGLKCIEMKKGDKLSRFVDKEWSETYVSLNAESGRAAFVCATVYNYIGEFLVMTFEKESSAFSIEVSIPVCAVMKDGMPYEFTPSVDENIISRTIYSPLPDIEMNYKKSAYINPHFLKDDSAGTYTFISSDPGTVSVDGSGRIYAAKKGTATIKVIYNDPEGPGLFDTCKVTVKYSFGQMLIRIFLFGWIWY
ncbi:MAG: Ig-like domain-containing protein [Clostridia bacterium]|nr:Ig-like domain-containing protein [Clostridia bacterium]